jgi:hydroxymethylglutaryl-CoA lyase
MTSSHVTIFEMGPRDGLQNEERIIPTDRKIRLIDMLSDCGFEKIEAASFVSPKWVPQMADSADVMAGITRREGVRYTALTPNMQGYDRAVSAGADEVAVFASASEGFSRANINCSIMESLVRFRPVIEAARGDGVPVRGYVSCVVACPYDGPVPPGKAAEVAGVLLKMGCYEVSLGDTIGSGTPETVAAILDAVLGVGEPEQFAGHYHDTGGNALANVEASLEKRIRVFDAAAGGLGGCPYAPGAKGNVATEAVAAMLAEKGFETGLDMDRLAEAAEFARGLRAQPGAD